MQTVERVEPGWDLVKLMYAPSVRAEEITLVAVDAAGRGGGGLRDALAALQAPIYVTDPDGVITYFNAACIGFAGRTPTVGKDRWCVTWKLYTDTGEFLPHDQCPMAVAICEQSAVRGVTAIAERPDGARVAFLPLPTPVFADDGRFLGAVNMLIDVTEVRQRADLRFQAERCQRLARAIGDRRTSDTLTQMANEFETKAAELEQSPLLARAA